MEERGRGGGPGRGRVIGGGEVFVTTDLVSVMLEDILQKRMGDYPLLSINCKPYESTPPFSS